MVNINDMVVPAMVTKKDVSIIDHGPTIKNEASPMGEMVAIPKSNKRAYWGRLSQSPFDSRQKLP